MIISIINSFIVFAVATFFAFYTARNKNRLPMISWSFLACALIYGIGSTIVFNATLSEVEYLRSDIVLSNKFYWPFYGPLVVVLLISIYIGWSLPIRKKGFYRKISKITVDTNKKQTLYLGIMLLVIGFILRLIYVQVYGGFIAYLDYSRAIRSGFLELNNPFSFLQPFSSLLILSSFYFWAIWVKGYQRSISSIGLILSILFSVYILLSNAGRVSFVLYILTFVLAIAYHKNISSKAILFFSLLGFPLSIISLYAISEYFNVKGADSISSYFIKEFSFVFVSFFNQLSNGELFRLFSDFIMAPTNLLPSSFTQGWFESAAQANTRLISGAAKGEDGVTGGIPVDLLTLGLMQFNVLGIPAVGLLFGFFLKRINFILESASNSSLSNILTVYFSLRLGFIGLIYAQPPHFVNGLFPLIVLIVLLYALNIFSRLKVSKS